MLKPVIAAAAAATLLLAACMAAPKVMSPPDYDTAPLDLSTPEGAAYSMMVAMYRGDAEMVDAVFLEGASLRRGTASGEMRPNGLDRWKDWVATLAVGEAHEELFALKVEEFGNLATVWAPFVITVKGEIAGCGVNQMSLARVEGDWRIVNAMDTPAESGVGCEAFRKQYGAG